MNYTDDQLKQLLAKMMPETVARHACGKYYWIGSANGFVLDTELLHLCSLVEAGLTEEQFREYGELLLTPFMHDPCIENAISAISPTWQQRTASLAEVKGVTL